MSLGYTNAQASKAKEELSITTSLNMYAGNQQVTPPEGKVMKKVTIEKPATLIPENIKKNVSIGGVTGTLDTSTPPVRRFLAQIVDYDGTVIKQEMLLEGDTFTLPSWSTITPPTGYSISAYAIPVEASNNAIIMPAQDVTIGIVYQKQNSISEYVVDVNKVSGLTVYCKLNGIKNWGDGTSDSNDAHTYADYGVYTITSSATEVPSYCFAASNSEFAATSCLTHVRLSNSITRINSAAFMKLFTLLDIIVPSSVIQIDDYAFASCRSLRSVTLPTSLSIVSRSTFSDCQALQSVVMPRLLRTLSYGVFAYCYSLRSITIPYYYAVSISTTSLFRHCYSLKRIVIPSNAVVECIATEAFENCYSLEYMQLPSTVTSPTEGIYSSAFSGCYNLQSITLPSNITTIGQNAFKYCSTLTDITIPSGVTSIGRETFSNCSSLETITLPELITSIPYGLFNYCYNLKTVNILGAITSIGHQAFQSCKSLTTITIDNSNGVSLGQFAFSDCTSLRTININGGVSLSSNCVFRNCYGLESIIFNNNTTSITYNSFYLCANLRELNVPSSVTYIESDAFNQANFINIYFASHTSVPSLASSSEFTGERKTLRIYVPDDLYDSWIVANNWSNVAQYIYKISERS